MLQSGDMTKRAEKWPIIGWWWHHPVMTTGRVGVWVCSLTKLKKTRRLKKSKNRALLRRSQKHYEIFSNNVLRKNITLKQLRLETIEIAWFKVGSVPSAWVVRDFISHSFHSVVAWFAIRHFVYLARRRKGLIIDLTDEYIFGYV